MIDLAEYYAALGRHPGWVDYVKGRIEEIEAEEPGFREAVRRIVVAVVLRQDGRNWGVSQEQGKRGDVELRPCSMVALEIEA